MGDIEFSIDDEPVRFSDRIGYRGFMFSGVPNLAWVFGYFRASWTLRADLICEFVMRMFEHMEKRQATVVTPTLRPEDAQMTHRPWVDPENFNPGYLERGMHLMPKQGDRQPWLFTQDYWSEKDEFPVADLEGLGALLYVAAPQVFARCRRMKVIAGVTAQHQARLRRLVALGIDLAHRLEEAGQPVVEGTPR